MTLVIRKRPKGMGDDAAVNLEDTVERINFDDLIKYWKVEWMDFVV